MNVCKMCGDPISSKKIYCNNICQGEYEHVEYIMKWKNGEVDGTRGGIAISKHVRKYLMWLHNESCSLCGWNKRNPKTNLVPLQIDHINGNPLDNSYENLRLLCPNCHSLTDTFGSLNKTGKGRRSIGIKYVAVAQ